jgi:hypothetical protein
MPGTYGHSADRAGPGTPALPIRRPADGNGCTGTRANALAGLYHLLLRLREMNVLTANNGIAWVFRRSGIHRGIGALFGALSIALLPAVPAAASQAPGLGAVLTTSDGGQIFGFDVNQNGNDGVLASAVLEGVDNEVSIQTFNQTTGEITATFAQETGSVDSYSVVGIAAGDVALVTHYVTPSGTIYATRYYDVMNPVTANKFTGSWTPPLKDINVQQMAENQVTSSSLMLVIELQSQDDPYLLLSDLATNTNTKEISLDPSLFGGDDGPVLGYYTSANEGVIALSPDAGAVHGKAPLNVLVNLSTGATEQFTGYNNGYYHAGSVNGMAVDPNTGVEATTTELNAQVEFYNLNTKKGIVAAQLPCTTNVSQLNSGSGIAVDPVNKLFLVSVQEYGCSSGGAILVYNESGSLVETISGFNFGIGEPAAAINPGTRTGWAFSGPSGVTQLQQFFY